MLELRIHQEEVVQKLREGFANGHRCQLLYAPTGFGKTEVAMAIMKAVADKCKKCAMVMDRIVLVDQTSRRLTKYGIEHGVMQTGHLSKPWKVLRLTNSMFTMNFKLEELKAALTCRTPKELRSGEFLMRSIFGVRGVSRALGCLGSI